MSPDTSHITTVRPDGATMAPYAADESRPGADAPSPGIVSRTRTLLQRRGGGYLGYLVTGIAFPKLWHRVAFRPDVAGGTSPRSFAAVGGDRPVRALLRDARRTSAATLTRTHAPLTADAIDVSDEVRTRLQGAAAAAAGEDVLLASRGAGEQWSWTLGSLDDVALPHPDTSGVTEEVVMWGGEFLLRRTYPPRSDALVREWFALTHLGGIPGIPALVRVDAPRGRLYLSLARGTTLHGAMREDPSRRDELARRVDLLLHAIHARGVTGVDASRGRVVVTHPDGTPLLLGFSRVRHAPRPTGRRFAARRDLDRIAFNQAHGTALLTEHSARTALAAARDRLTSYEDYAPIDFGDGVTLGRVLTTDSGTGRWEFFNRHIVAPLVQGRRVLDLGSNNGSMPTAMLRAGAREVVGVEMNPSLADLCELSARIFEWRDMRPYQLTVHRRSMTDFLAAPWGEFDVVTAFCSLYYLGEEEMAAMVRRASGMGATMILQSNERIDPGLRRVASATFLERLLRENGYRDVTTHCPPGYTRVLLVGSRDGRTSP